MTRSLDYIKIVGPGVDALERRKEHDNNHAVSAAELRTSIKKLRAAMDRSWAASISLRLGCWPSKEL